MGFESKRVTSSFICGICMEEKSRHELFTYAKCKNPSYYCIECMEQHVTVKVTEDPSKVKCPDPLCCVPLEPRLSPLLAGLPEEVIFRWETGFVSEIICSRQRNSCPYLDCRARLPEMPAAMRERAEYGSVVECGECRRLVCSWCRVEWHWGMKCSKYWKSARRDKDDWIKIKRICEDSSLGHADKLRFCDSKFKQLAKSNHWKPCPNCRLYVLKDYGCDHIHCRCGFHFCYSCGKPWGDDHTCAFWYLKSQFSRLRYLIRSFFI